MESSVAPALARHVAIWQDIVLQALLHPNSNFNIFLDGRTIMPPDFPWDRIKRALKKRGFQFTGKESKGGFGVVAHAVKQGSDREVDQMDVAVKVCFKPLDDSEEVQKELERLKQNRSLLFHSRLITLHGILRQEVDGKKYLVTWWEWAEQSLADRLAECQRAAAVGIKAAEAAPYIEHAAEGLDFLATMHVWHADIKPANLLVGHGGVRIGDVGMMRIYKLDSSRTLVAHTARYAAPEVLGGQQPTAQSDAYSLAVSYVELRTGKFPSPHGNGENCPALCDLLPCEAKLVLEMLSANPKSRPGVLDWAKRLDDCVKSAPATPVIIGITREKVLDRLCKVYGPSLGTIVFKIQMGNAAPAVALNDQQKCLEIVKWADSENGCGLERLNQAINELK